MFGKLKSALKEVGAEGSGWLGARRRGQAMRGPCTRLFWLGPRSTS